MRIQCAVTALVCTIPAFATVFGTVHGVVHDPSHRPIARAEVKLEAARSSFVQTAQTDDSGGFEFRAVPAGEYRVRLALAGFAEADEPLVVTSGSSPVVHIQLKIAAQTQSVEVSETAP